MDKEEIIAELRRDLDTTVAKINFKSYNPTSSVAQSAINIYHLLKILEAPLPVVLEGDVVSPQVHQEQAYEAPPAPEPEQEKIVLAYEKTEQSAADGNNFIVDELRSSEKYFELYKQTGENQLLEIARQELAHAAYWLNKEHMRAKTAPEQQKLKTYQKLYLNMKDEIAHA